MDIFKAAGMEVEKAPEPEIIEDTNAVTKEQIRAALPGDLSTKVTDSLVQKLNSVSMDPDIADEIRSNFIGFQNVLRDGKFKLEDYLSACAYVSFKMMGYTNQDAWAHTFPDRKARLVAAGKDDKTISAYVSSYHKNKLVNMIMEQSLIPSYVLNQDLYQKALSVCGDLMINAKSEKVQVDAAKAVLDALKQPEKSKVELDVTVKDDTGIAELKRVMQDVADNQIKRIESGTPTKEIAHQDVFTQEGEPV